MPDLSGNRTTIRTDGYALDIYFTPLMGTQVYSATVASTPTFPANALSITGGSGTIGDVKRGMRVTVESSGGVYRGETHIRAAGTISAAVIPIRETSRPTINIQSGDVIRVYNAIYLQDKLVSPDATFSPDNLAYSAQNSTVAPIAISGGHFVGFVDSGQTYRTVVFAGSESYTVDADSAGTVSHSWVFPTATGTTTSSSANPSFTFPVGYHIGSHTVTDSSNSATWTQFIMGYVYDDNNPPYQCVIPSLNAAVNTGWNGEVQVFEAADLTDIPDGCMGIIWTRETYAGTVQSFGNVIPSRSHIKAVGYIARETVDYNAVDDTLTFELISPLARLQALPGYSKVMLNNTSPDQWREVDDLSVKRAIIILLRYYTNLTEIYDFLYDADTYAFPRFYLQKSTPAGQVTELADGVDARFVVNRTGRFMVQKRQELTVLGDRSALTTTLTLALQDIITYQFTRDHYRTVELLEARGFTADQTDPDPIFARWPGLGPGQGTQSSVVERLIAESQVDLSRRAGLRGAALDGVFVNGAGEYRKAFDLRLTLRGGYDVFDYYKEWVALSIDETTNLRGVDLSAYRYTFQSATITYDHQTASAETELTLRAETAALAGVAFTPTTPPSSNTPDYTPPDLDVGFTPVPDATVLYPGYDPDNPQLPIRVFATSSVSAQAAIADSYDAGLGTINWTEISTGLTGTCQWAAGDPYDYGRMFVLTTTGLYKCEDIWAFDGWSLVASNATMLTSSSNIAHKIEMNITKRGMIVAMSGNRLAISFDYGITWTQVDFSGVGGYRTSPSISATATGDFAIDQAIGTDMYATVYVAAGSSSYYRSTDYGLTWSLRTSFAFAFASTRIFIPYRQRGGLIPARATRECYVQWTSGASGGIYVSTNGFSSVASLFNSAPFGQFTQATTQRVMMPFTWDANYWYSIGYNASFGNRYSIFKTTDGAANVTEPLNNVVGNNIIAGNGWPIDPDVFIYWSQNGALLKISLDGGATTFGSVPAFFTGGGFISYAELSLVDFVAPR